MRKTLIFLALVSALSFGQTHDYPAKDTDNVMTGKNTFTKGVTLGPVTYSALSGLGATEGYVVRCSDCTNGIPTASGGSGALVQFAGGQWGAFNGGGGGGGGSVTSVSTGSMSPLFTASIATPTTTPALSFSLSNANPNTVFGNCTVSSGQPSYCQLTSAMLPTGVVQTAGGTLNSLPKFVTNTTTLGNSLFTDNGTLGAYTGSGFGVGSSAPGTCGSAVGCWAATGGTTGGTPTAGQAYIRYDSSAKLYRVQTDIGSENNLPEFTNNGTVGQVPLSNGDGTYSVGDPLVSFAPVTLFNLQSATGSATSSLARLSALGTSGTFYITYAGITGSPSGCALQVKSADSLGNSVNNSGAIITNPANGTTTSLFNSTASIYSATQMGVAYTCIVYPSGGTISVEFAPMLPGTTNNPTSTPVNNNLQQVGGTAVAPVSTGNLPVEIRGKMQAGSLNYPICDQVQPFSFNTSGQNQILAASGGGVTYHICALVLVSASTTAVTAQMYYGTQSTTPCDTGAATLSASVPLQAISANAPVGITIAPPNSDWKPLAANQQLCLNLSASQTVTGQVNYAKY